LTTFKPKQNIQQVCKDKCQKRDRLGTGAEMSEKKKNMQMGLQEGADGQKSTVGYASLRACMVDQGQGQCHNC